MYGLHLLGFVPGKGGFSASPVKVNDEHCTGRRSMDQTMAYSRGSKTYGNLEMLQRLEAQMRLLL